VVHGWRAVAPGRVGMPTAYVEATGYGGEAEGDDRLRLSDVAKLGRRLRRGVIRSARFDDRPTFPKVLAAHLQTDVDSVEVVEESWQPHDLVNVQVGLDAFLAADGATHELVGMRNHRHQQFGLADLLRPSEHQQYGPHPGNVAWTQLATGPDGQVTPAALAALYLVTLDSLPGLEDGPVRLALMLRAADPESDIGLVQLHLVADRPGAAAAAATQIRRLALEHNVFRGQVITFQHDLFGERASAMQFRRRPAVSADDVILPAETLETIRRQVVGVARHREALLAAGQHLKRGLLLHGPPGVGKTHSLRYLIAQMTDVTVIELSGDSLGGIATACSVARSLQPAMIVVEDVDLIAEDREMYEGSSPLLFQLLNEMDGLAEDTDVVFLLTTNRADVLEPALAARPGRVDQAVELRLPDADARRRLFALYRGGLEVEETRLDDVIGRTDGVTASFIKELLRRAALIAADAADAGDGGGRGLRVTAAQLDEALEELMDTRNAMTRTLLGGQGPNHRRPRRPPVWDDDEDDEGDQD
jgi:ATP-dependent 26S proteasome regulatory subunit